MNVSVVIQLLAIVMAPDPMVKMLNLSLLTVMIGNCFLPLKLGK
jgi:energy-converting hydrogenase Eha subunit E